MIQTLAKMGGVFCIPFMPQTVSQEFRDKWHTGRPPRGSMIVGLEPLVYRGDPTKIYEFIEERKRLGQSRRAETGRERSKDLPPLSNFIDQIDYAVRLVGVAYLGISSDFAGYPVNLRGMETAGEYQNIAQALLRRGYSREDVAKIMGENLLRIFDEVVRTAKPQ